MISLLLLALTACTPDDILTSATYPEDMVVVCGEAITFNDDTTMNDDEFMMRASAARDLRHQCSYWNLSFPAAVTTPPVDATVSTTDSSETTAVVVPSTDTPAGAASGTDPLPETPVTTPVTP
jgi:hypothetical protein